MKLKTLTPITIVQARIFEDEQGFKGIKKENIFSQEDCKWELEVTERKMENGFSAKVQWFQIQQYEDVDENGNPITRELSRLMYNERFVLSRAEVDGMFNQMGISIIPNQDSFSEKVDEIILNGIIYWVGVVRQIFGLDTSGFEE
tara:strand:+ start:887 stop:1321 length:435 start_codon:yes stop_codon:yes gene_type:complete